MPPHAVESPGAAATSFDDDAWEGLRNFIEEKQVIPTIGPEWVVVQTDVGPENQDKWVRRALAARLALEPRTLPAAPTLDDG